MGIKVKEVTYSSWRNQLDRLTQDEVKRYYGVPLCVYFSSGDTNNKYQGILDMEMDFTCGKLVSDYDYRKEYDKVAAFKEWEKTNPEEVTKAKNKFRLLDVKGNDTGLWCNKDDYYMRDDHSTRCSFFVDNDIAMITSSDEGETLLEEVRAMSDDECLLTFDLNRKQCIAVLEDAISLAIYHEEEKAAEDAVDDDDRRRYRREMDLMTSDWYN